MQVNQKFSWSLLVAGLGLFIWQLGDVLPAHSSWSDVFSPGGIGEVMKVAGGAIMAVLGALGIRVGNTPVEAAAAKEAKARAASKLPALFLIASLGLGAPACAAFQPANTPASQEEVERLERDVTRAVLATTTTLALIDQVLMVADGLERGGKLAPATLADIAGKAKSFSVAADGALHDLALVMERVTLENTAKVLLDRLAPLLASLEGSTSEGLAQLGAAIRIGMVVVRTIGGTL